MNGEEVEYWYEDGRLLYEKRGTDKEFYYSYDGYGNLSCIRYFLNGAQYTYYFLTNARGDVELIYGGSGVVLARYTYDSWGNTISIKDGDGEEITDPTNIALLNPIRYRGYYYDSETGLYYLQSRYYDPTTCRFVNADSQVDICNLMGLNVFAYCGNDPVNQVDPTGRSFIAIAGLVLVVVGIVFGCTGSSSVTTAEKTPIDPSVPPPPSSGYIPPKKNPNPQKVPNPNGNGKGWPSEGGGVWVPDNKQHGGPGWTEQFPGGKHKHHYPDGHVREICPEPINLDPLVGTGLVIAGIIAGAYIIANDITGIGAADDWLLGPVGGLITEGGILIFG